MRRAIFILCFMLLFSTAAVAGSKVQYTVDGKNVDSSVIMNNGHVTGSVNSNSFWHFRRLGRVQQKSTVCIGKVKCKSNLRMSSQGKSAYANLNQ